MTKRTGKAMWEVIGNWNHLILTREEMRSRLLAALKGKVNSEDVRVVDEIVGFIYELEDLNGVSFEDFDELIEDAVVAHGATFVTRECDNQGHRLPEQLFERLQSKFPKRLHKSYISGWCKYYMRKSVVPPASRLISK